MSAAVSIVPAPPVSETRLLGRRASLSDPELVTLASFGDRAAFGELTRRHRRDIYGFALNRLRDPSAADDVTQEAFARVFVKMPMSFESSSSFAAYVCAFARNLCMNRSAWLGRRRFVDVDDPASRGALASVAKTQTPADEFEQHEVRETMRTAFATLTPTTHRVVSMLLDGADRAEVAASLGMSENAVSSHLGHAREQLAPKGAAARKVRKVLLTYKGRSGTLRTFAKEAGLSITGLCRRLRTGMTLEQAIETPVVTKKRNKRTARALDPIGT